MIRKRAGVLACLAASALAVALAAGCAPQQGGSASKAEDADRPDAVQVAWSIDSDCESCHVTEAASSSDATSLHGAHATDACALCHDDERGLAAAHEKYATGDPASKLKKTSVSNAACLASGCHDQAELAAATAEETVLTDTKGTVVNPHDLPVHDDHEKGATCSSCHKMHGAKTIEIETVTQASKATCLSCHHHEVYECHTCHT